MPIYEIENGKTLKHIEHKTFQEVNLKECQHLQVLLRDNIAAISPDLFVITEEFSDWTDSGRRVDLLALDRDVNLVIIELKRVEDGSRMELQSLRYAAMLAPMDFEAVLLAHQKFLKKQNRDAENAKNDILKFLKTNEEIEIGSSPRIILVAPTFSKEITTHVLWLNDRGLNIKCLQARPYRIENKLYIDIEQIIPLLSASEYQTSLGKKSLNAERQATIKRREQTIAALQASGHLKLNSRLVQIRPIRQGMTVIDDKAKHAAFPGDVGSGSFAGPDYWALEGETVPLSFRVKELLPKA